MWISAARLQEPAAGICSSLPIAILWKFKYLQQKYMGNNGHMVDRCSEFRMWLVRNGTTTIIDCWQLIYINKYLSDGSRSLFCAVRFRENWLGCRMVDQCCALSMIAHRDQLRGSLALRVFLKNTNNCNKKEWEIMGTWGFDAVRALWDPNRFVRSNLCTLTFAQIY